MNNSLPSVSLIYLREGTHIHKELTRRALCVCPEGHTICSPPPPQTPSYVSGRPLSGRQSMLMTTSSWGSHFTLIPSYMHRLGPAQYIWQHDRVATCHYLHTRTYARLNLPISSTTIVKIKYYCNHATTQLPSWVQTQHIIFATSTMQPDSRGTKAKTLKFQQGSNHAYNPHPLQFFKELMGHNCSTKQAAGEFYMNALGLHQAPLHHWECRFVALSPPRLYLYQESMAQQSSRNQRFPLPLPQDHPQSRCSPRPQEHPLLPLQEQSHSQ